MRKLYNTNSQITSDLSKFFKIVAPSISKPHLKNSTDVILGMIKSESVVTTDIVKNLKDLWSETQPSSTVRRLERFFNNTLFKPYDFYDSIIQYVIKNYKSKNKNVYISFDHTFCRESFTILFFSLRVGKQGIPLCFRCFKGNNDPKIFELNLIKEGIYYVHSLFENSDYKLIFLADRWFNFREIMHHIDSLGHEYCIRTKSNLFLKIKSRIVFILKVLKCTIFKLFQQCLLFYVLLFFGLLFWALIILKIKVILKITLRSNTPRKMWPVISE